MSSVFDWAFRAIPKKIPIHRVRSNILTILHNHFSICIKHCLSESRLDIYVLLDNYENALLAGLKSDF